MLKKYFPIILIISLLSFPLYGDIEDLPSMTVQGKGVLAKPADQLLLSVGVITQEKTADEALKQNSEKMEKVIAALKSAGLTTDEYKTGRFTIRPLYHSSQSSEEGIRGYEVKNSLEVRTERLDQAATLIDVANRAGANSIDNIRFTLKDPGMYRDEAIQTAVKNGARDAKTLAEASGVSLKRIVKVVLDQADVSPVRGQQAVLYMSKSSAPPIEAGDVEVQASVMIIYEIDN